MILSGWICGACGRGNRADAHVGRTSNIVAGAANIREVVNMVELPKGFFKSLFILAGIGVFAIAVVLIAIVALLLVHLYGML